MKSKLFYIVDCLTLTCILLWACPIVAPSLVCAESTTTRGVTHLGRIKNFFGTRHDVQPEIAVSRVVYLDNQTATTQPSVPDKDKSDTSANLHSTQAPSSFTSIKDSAPESFKQLIRNQELKDFSAAERAADRFVEHMNNLAFMVRDTTRMIIAAKIRSGELDEEDARGVEQLLDWEMALARRNASSPFSPSHQQALKRITPDPKGQVDVYFFFSLNCRYCRDMGPDLERLHRAFAKDKNVKVSALVLGNPPKVWVDSFKDYTGLTVPVLNGEEAAKKLRISFLPALVVVSPNTQLSYLRTGQIEFERMYELVRTVEGLPIDQPESITRLAQLPIGEIEHVKLGYKPGSISKHNYRAKQRTSFKINRF